MRKTSLVGSHSKGRLLLCLLLEIKTHISNAWKFRSKWADSFSSIQIHQLTKRSIPQGFLNLLLHQSAPKSDSVHSSIPWQHPLCPGLPLHLRVSGNPTSCHQGKVIRPVKSQVSYDIVKLECQWCVSTHVVIAKHAQLNVVMFAYRSGAERVSGGNEKCPW